MILVYLVLSIILGASLYIISLAFLNVVLLIISSVMVAFGGLGIYRFFFKEKDKLLYSSDIAIHAGLSIMITMGISVIGSGLCALSVTALYNGFVNKEFNRCESPNENSELDVNASINPDEVKQYIFRFDDGSVYKYRSKFDGYPEPKALKSNHIFTGWECVDNAKDRRIYQMTYNVK